MNKVCQLHLDGMAGVHAVAEQLCWRGLTPYFPSVDSGVDILLANGLRIQVKTGRLRMTHPAYRFGAYVLDTRKGRLVKKGKVISNVRGTSYVGTADFFVFFAVDERRFFVIPTAAHDGAAWICRKGYEYQRVGKGRVAKITGKIGKAANVLQYEEAWHLLDIDSTLQNLELAEAVAEAERVEQ